jgi:pimeloyl-ACP methyl ester carboxylesterase
MNAQLDASGRDMTRTDATTQTTRSSTLEVPGARLYYEARGSGPLLLMIPGGPTDAGVFADISRHLADRYTVVAYDPRGNSRSTFDGEPTELRLDVQADDAARLIEALGDGPAYVFGSSGGAQIGLELAARYPERVRALVAHEPSCVMMLPDPSEPLAADKDVYETYRREGVEAATRKFMALAGLSDEPVGEGAPAEAGLSAVPSCSASATAIWSMVRPADSSPTPTTTGGLPARSLATSGR